MPAPDAYPLHHLDAVDAFKLAVEQSGLPLPEIAKRMGWSMPQARRVFSAEKYFPSFPDLPRFCIAVGNLTVVHWLLAKATPDEQAQPHAPLDCASLLLRVADLFTEVGHVAEEACRAASDDRLQVTELRRLLKELADVLERGMALVGDLRQMERMADA
ncbi:phage regulatory CII family protein [Nitratidesulfovibrio sp. HK-II]|uniref:phage regulatory CII family protein n=1 Tax=Nitratidesulfovibrio sp. HK-II TaxID=2009266 RepID=UPI000EE79B24|nr:phage regulatory CII family protein [Nitratidesulfovibrio sp. HK-II]GBO96150.1 hypothetical protein RVX_1190 [Nitratidesulfovibrio sp. HK-II]